MKDPLKQLAIADPDLAAKVKTVLDQKADPIPLEDIVLLVNETLWALSEEISFGQAVAGGYADLIGEASAHKIESYRDLVRKFGHQGPTLGRIMATHLAPVCKYGGDRLLNLFLETFEIMLTKGTYTLKDPLQALSALIKIRDLESVSVYLKLLGDTLIWSSKNGHPVKRLLPKKIYSQKHLGFYIPKTNGDGDYYKTFQYT